MELSQLGGPKAEETLLSVLSDTTRPREIRQAAASGLNNFGSTAIAAYRTLIEELDPSSGQTSPHEED